VLPPRFDQHLGFHEGVEHLGVEQLVTKLAIERLVVAVLPWTGLLDVEGVDAEPAQPGPDGLGDELLSLVRADVLGRSALDEQIG
jgi:hypothetical protein